MLINKNLCNILRILKDSEKPLNVGDISKALHISQPLCSQRLKILKNNYKLITSKKVSNIVYYSLKDNVQLVDNLLNIVTDLTI